MYIADTTKPIVSESPSRLIALVPSDLVDAANFAQEIHWLAHKLGRNVLYLSLDGQEKDQLAISRLLANLESITQDTAFTVKSTQVKAASWVDAITQVITPDDMVVCHETQVARVNAINSIPLSEYLEKEQKLRVHILTGYSALAAYPRGWANNLLFWFGFLTILAGFSFLEFRVQNFLVGAPEKIVFIFLFVLEFGLIYGWTEITS